MADGNGKAAQAHVTVQFDRPRPGWVVLHIKEATVGLDLSLHLHRALTEWLTSNPGVRVRAALPIVTNGQTLAVHIWHDGQEGQPPRA